MRDDQLVNILRGVMGAGAQARGPRRPGHAFPHFVIIDCSTGGRHRRQGAAAAVTCPRHPESVKNRMSLSADVARSVEPLPGEFGRSYEAIKELDEYTCGEASRAQCQSCWRTPYPACPLFASSAAPPAELAVRVREDVAAIQAMTSSERSTVGVTVEDKVRGGRWGWVSPRRRWQARALRR